MTTDYQPPRARFNGGLIRDILAVALVLAGVTGIAVAAFAVDWRLGLTALGASAIASGVFLGYER